MNTATQIEQEVQFITEVHNQALKNVLSRLEEYTHGELVVSDESAKLLDKEHTFLRKRYVSALRKAYELAQKAQKKERTSTARVPTINYVMKSYRDEIAHLTPLAARAWIIDGPIIRKQTGSIKYLAGISNEEESMVVDIVGSATSLSLGAENPWLILADRYEDHLGIRDNICQVYHSGLRQGFTQKQIALLYPGPLKPAELTVYTESSATIVNCAAIESVVAYAEKKSGGKILKKVLAVDGTWAGAYGSAREGTGFGIDTYQTKRSGGSLWVDRCLPAPTKENGELFLKIVEGKINDGTAAGVYLEPDIIGDLGIVVVDAAVLHQLKRVLKKHGLPVIFDCVQQLGRTGSYLGDNVDKVFDDYELMCITTGKSVSNGQPFGYNIIPKKISSAASSLSQTTTNNYNGPLLRVLTVAEVLKNSQMQKWFGNKMKAIEAVSAEYGVNIGFDGLRGKYLNRALALGDNETVKLVQLALLIEDGILAGALPQSIRYQPMLLELSVTNELLARVIFNRVKEVKAGNINKDVLSVYKTLIGQNSGLARNKQ